MESQKFTEVYRTDKGEKKDVFYHVVKKCPRIRLRLTSMKDKSWARSHGRCVENPK